MVAMAHSDSTYRDALLTIFAQEREAELEHQAGLHDKAIRRLQALVNTVDISKPDRGWCIQVIAIYCNLRSKAESSALQCVAHQKNTLFLRPRECMRFQKEDALRPEKRVELIISWIKQFNHFESLMLSLMRISRLCYARPADWTTRHLCTQVVTE